MPCPICSSQQASVVMKGLRDASSGESFALSQCNGCSLIRTDPVPEELGRYYDSEDYYAFRVVETTPLERIRLGLIVKVAYRGLNGSKLLDVGCGSGRLTAAFARLGWHVSGLDPSTEAIAIARSVGIDAFVGTLADPVPWEPGSFDAVVMNHSLEHVPDPLQAMRRVRELLRSGGRAGITVPNYASWQRARLGRDWFQLDVPRHVTHFTPETLVRTCEAAGLSVLRVATHSMGATIPAALTARGLPMPGPIRPAVQYATLAAVAATDVFGHGDCINLIAQAP